MSECRKAEEIVRGSEPPEDRHVRDCRDCREALAAHNFFRRLAAADDLAPALPDPRILILKADLLRRQVALRAEGDRTRWAGVAIWATIAITWLVVLTWKLDEIRGLAERFNIVPALPGGSMAIALLVAAFGGLVAFTVFAVAVHSVLAEL